MSVSARENNEAMSAGRTRRTLLNRIPDAPFTRPSCLGGCGRRNQHGARRDARITEP
jgi:hypothetical protein